MTKTIPFVALLSVSLASFNLLAKEPTLPKSKYKTVIFQDDFSAEKLQKEWKHYKSASVVRNGHMVGITPKTADHPAVNTIYFEPKADLEVKVDFKFAGSPQFNVMYRDKECKSSHAGHICHVNVRKNKIVLHDGKTGIFRKDIREKRKAKMKLDAATQKMLKTKSATFPLKLDPGKWHTLVIRINGDVMVAYIDNKKVGSLKSEGIAHTRVDQVNLTTMAKEMHYDNFSIKSH